MTLELIVLGKTKKCRCGRKHTRVLDWIIWPNIGIMFNCDGCGSSLIVRNSHLGEEVLKGMDDGVTDVLSPQKS